MEIRQPIHSEHAKRLDTEGLRKEFLIENLFCEGEMNLTYSHIDRIIVGGVVPTTQPLALMAGKAIHTYPTRKITQQQASPEKLGNAENCNVRTIYKFLHPSVLPTCQLSMGMTVLEPGSLWNTMPCHTHERRMEVYLYFDMKDDNVVFHYMGEPTETRHLVVRNEQAVISPSWSIHSGVGSASYTFIWGMVGENQVFHDMDHVAMKDLK